MPQVTILRRDASIDPLDPEGVKPALRVTYSTATHSPRPLFIPGENLTEEQIAGAIRQDLASLEAEPPPTIEV